MGNKDILNIEQIIDSVYDSFLDKSVLLDVSVKQNKMNYELLTYYRKEMQENQNNLINAKNLLNQKKSSIGIEFYNSALEKINIAIDSFEDIIYSVDNFSEIFITKGQSDYDLLQKKVKMCDESFKLLRGYFKEKSVDKESQILSQGSRSVNNEATKEFSKQEIDSLDHIHNQSYNKDVSRTLIINEINDIKSQMNSIANKEKLNAIDKVKLAQFEYKLTGLTSVLESLEKKEEKGLVALREKSLNEKEDKIDMYEKKKEEMSSQTYNTRIFNSIKDFAIKRIDAKITKLKEKRGVIMGKQRKAATVKFDRKNNKVTAISNIKGLVTGGKSVVVDTYNSAVDYTKSLIVDVRNFASNSNKLNSIIERLKNKKGVIIMTSPMVSNERKMAI